MKERPILFSGAMVRALLAGTKWQTRRALKHQPFDVIEVASGNHLLDFRHSFSQQDSVVPMSEHAKACPYGQPGDQLWVRETWNWFDPAELHHSRRGARAPFTGCQGARSIEWVAAYAADGCLEHIKDGSKALWRPSIHMPRWASRLTLDLVSVRVERLQDISEADALAEGIVRQPDGGFGLADTTHYHATDPRICYWSLWDAINGAGAVEKNPVVWVLGFPQPTTAQP